jgi:hypothetical protein
MRLNHALRGRRAVIVAAATVALGAVASPAFARARSDAGPTVHGISARSDRTAGVERRDRFRARYQLQLNEGRKLLGA